MSGDQTLDSDVRTLDRRKFLGLSLATILWGTQEACMTVRPKDIVIPKVDASLENAVKDTHLILNPSTDVFLKGHEFPKYATETEAFFYVLYHINRAAEDCNVRDYYVSGKAFAELFKERGLKTHIPLEKIKGLTRTGNRLSFTNDKFSSYIPRARGHVKFHAAENMQFAVDRYADENILLLQVADADKKPLKLRSSITAKIFYDAVDLDANWVKVQPGRVEMFEAVPDEEASIGYKSYSGKKVTSSQSFINVKPYGDAIIKEIQQYFAGSSEKPYFLFNRNRYNYRSAFVDIALKKMDTSEGHFYLAEPDPDFIKRIRNKEVKLGQK